MQYTRRIKEVIRTAHCFFYGSVAYLNRVNHRTWYLNMLQSWCCLTTGTNFYFLELGKFRVLAVTEQFLHFFLGDAKCSSQTRWIHCNILIKRTLFHRILLHDRCKIRRIHIFIDKTVAFVAIRFHVVTSELIIHFFQQCIRAFPISKPHIPSYGQCNT